MHDAIRNATTAEQRLLRRLLLIYRNDLQYQITLLLSVRDCVNSTMMTDFSSCVLLCFMFIKQYALHILVLSPELHFAYFIVNRR